MRAKFLGLVAGAGAFVAIPVPKGRVWGPADAEMAAEMVGHRGCGRWFPEGYRGFLNEVYEFSPRLNPTPCSLEHAGEHAARDSAYVYRYRDGRRGVFCLCGFTEYAP